MTDKPQLPIDEAASAVPEVPSFGCIVYVRPVETGVSARVANLDGISVQAANEREALGKIVPQFKNIVQGHLQAGTPVPWIDPPAQMTEDEQKRFLPTHL